MNKPTTILTNNHYDRFYDANLLIGIHVVRPPVYLS